jgi:hypothetical protein
MEEARQCMAILSPLRLEGWVIGRAPTVPESRLSRSLAIHSLLPPPSPPSSPPTPSSSSPPFYLFLPHKGAPPPCAHARQAWQQSKYRTYCGQAVVHAHSMCCCDLALSCTLIRLHAQHQTPPPLPVPAAPALYTTCSVPSWAALSPRTTPSPLGHCLLPSVAYLRQATRGDSF